MSDAWEILVSNSLIAEGDAWEHLNAQGGECETSAVILGDLEGTVITPVILVGDILPVEINGVVTEVNSIVGVVDDTVVEGIIDKEDIGGKVNEC